MGIPMQIDISPTREAKNNFIKASAMARTRDHRSYAQVVSQASAKNLSHAYRDTSRRQSTDSTRYCGYSGDSTEDIHMAVPVEGCSGEKSNIIVGQNSIQRKQVRDSYLT